MTGWRYAFFSNVTYMYACMCSYVSTHEGQRAISNVFYWSLFWGEVSLKVKLTDWLANRLLGRTYLHSLELGRCITGYNMDAESWNSCLHVCIANTSHLWAVPFVFRDCCLWGRRAKEEHHAVPAHLGTIHHFLGSRIFLGPLAENLKCRWSIIMRHISNRHSFLQPTYTPTYMMQSLGFTSAPDVLYNVLLKCWLL